MTNKKENEIEKEKIKENLLRHLEHLEDGTSQYWGLPDYIMCVFWSNMAVLEELRDLNKKRLEQK